MTTPKMNAALSDIFDLELTTTDKPIDEIKIEAKKAETETLEKQRDYVRGNMIELIESGKTILQNMANIANSTEAGKDFDVVSRLLKTLVDSNAKLLEMEITGKPQNQAEVVQKSKDIPQSAEQITNNTVFVGSTTELSQFLKNRQTTINVDNK